MRDSRLNEWVSTILIGHPITIPTGEFGEKVCRRQTTGSSPRPGEGEVRRRRTEARSVAGGHAGPAKPEARPAIDNQSAMRPTSGRAAERVGINSGSILAGRRSVS